MRASNQSFKIAENQLDRLNIDAAERPDHGYSTTLEFPHTQATRRKSLVNTSWSGNPSAATNSNRDFALSAGAVCAANMHRPFDERIMGPSVGSDSDDDDVFAFTDTGPRREFLTTPQIEAHREEAADVPQDDVDEWDDALRTDARGSEHVPIMIDETHETSSMRDLNLMGCLHPGHVHACHRNEWSVNELPASESSLNEFPLDGFSPIQTRTGCFSFNNEPSLAWRPPKSSSSEFPYIRARTPNQMPPRSMQVPERSQYPSSASGLVSRDLKPDEDPRDLLSESPVAMLPGQAYKRSRSLTSMSDMPSSVHTNEQSLFRYRNRRDAYVRSTKTSSRVVGADEDKESWEDEHELNSLNDSDEAVDHDEESFIAGDGIEEDSPYPEVRASVSNIDDPSMPTATFRVIFLSLFLSTLAGAANTYFMLRYPAPTVSPIVITVVSYPLGKLMAAVLPTRTVQLPSFLGGSEFLLNPGAFNIKEHTLISSLASISIMPSYIVNFLVSRQIHFTHRGNHQYWFDYLYMIFTRVIGFSFSGLLYRFLVEPASMLWPQVLVVTTILNTLHAEDDRQDKRISRMRWLVYVVFGAFFYNFLPGLFFEFLTVFCWLCWIRPTDRVLNIVAGANGMGLTSFTFDWGQISFFGSPMVTPWWAECNFFAGFVLFAWIVMPILYFTNTWGSGYFPFTGHMAYDKFGKPYQEEKVIQQSNFQFQQQKYLEYSPLYLSIGFVVSYFGGFASITAVILNMILNHYDDILRALQRKTPETPDIHAKLMRRYKHVPTSWYFTTLCICFIALLLIVDFVSFKVPMKAIIVGMVLPLFYTLPSGFVVAMSGQMIGDNILADVIGAYLTPNLPEGFSLFKSLAVQTLTGCLQFTGNMKLGHYMKIPPRTMFLLQIVCATITGCVQMAVKDALVMNVPDICTENSKYQLSCWSPNLYFVTSLLWSSIGPRYIFKGEAFQFILWGLLAGTAAPIITALIKWKWKLNWINYVSWPIFFFGVGMLPLSRSINFTAWFSVAFFFQFYLRKYYFSWWSKYNFVTANALDIGTILSELLIFVAITLPTANQNILQWWPNTVVKRNADAHAMPLYKIPQGGIPSPEHPKN